MPTPARSATQKTLVAITDQEKPQTLHRNSDASVTKTVASSSSTHSATPDITQQASKAPALTEAQRSQFKSLAGQFACYVGISTFTAGLVVGFLSLSRALVDMPPTNPLSEVRSTFEVGVALGIASIGLHLGVVLVGIRAGALCIRRTALEEDLESGESSHCDSNLGDFLRDLTARDFYRYIRYCERLQLLGSLFFVATLVYMSFLMFHVEAWPWVLLGATVLGLLTLLHAGVWKMSVMWESVELTTKWFARLFRRKQGPTTSHA